MNLDRFEDWLWDQDLADSRVVMQAFKAAELYEYMPTIQARIDTVVDDMLNELGFED